VTTRRPVAFAAMLLVVLFAVGACGSGGSGISSLAGTQMQLRVAAIRESVANGDRNTAENQLSQLRVDVVQFRADDKINDSAAQRILRAADVVQARLSLLDPPPTTATTTSSTTSTSTTTTTKPPKDKGHDDKGKGGKGD
jgi:hypothetical protein